MCLLLAAKFAVVCCCQEYNALEGSCPLKTRAAILAGEYHQRTRDFFFFFINPCHLLFPISLVLTILSVKGYKAHIPHLELKLPYEGKEERPVQNSAVRRWGLK